MLVKAKRKGYYGERVRKAGMTFNYTPKDKKAFDKGDEKLPSWVEAVNIDVDADPNKSRNDKLESLSSAVDKAKENLKNAEAAASVADDKLSSATKKADKEVAQDAANVANEAVDDATIALSEAEDDLTAAES